MPPEFDADFISRFMERDKQMFAFVFQQKSAPFTTRCWAMTPYIAEIGHKKFVMGIGAYMDNKRQPTLSGRVATKMLRTLLKIWFQNQSNISREVYERQSAIH